MLCGLHEGTQHRRDSTNNLTSDLGTKFLSLLYDLLPRPREEPTRRYCPNNVDP